MDPRGTLNSPFFYLELQWLAKEKVEVELV
jgi:hypothetical protein